MKHIILMLLVVKFCNGQHQEDLEFCNSVIEAARQTHQGQVRIMDVDSLTTSFFASGNVNTTIDTLVRWQVMFEKSVNWEHTLSLELPEISLDDAYLNEVSKKDLKPVYEKAKSFSGSELYKKFAISQELISPDRLSKLPVIQERNDPLNHIWIPYTDGYYLILRYVHSYPDGNMTSFYRERLLYFRRI